MPKSTRVLALLALACLPLTARASSLVSIANPSPGGGDRFGTTVATLGTSAVIVGSPNDAVSTGTGTATAGSVFVVDATSGATLLSIPNPTPKSGDKFGNAVASAGSNVLVGAPYDDTGTSDAGAAYLFDGSTGALLRTFLNPTAADSDHFGAAVAATGNYVLVGAPEDDTAANNAGAVYVFDATNGNLLGTITGPAAASGDGFGNALAIRGTSVIIGAYKVDAGASDAGAVYVFDIATRGLLRSIPNPSPNGSDFFGWSVAAVGNDVLAGAYQDDTGATNAGSAYLFDGDTGVLKRTFNNPTPGQSDFFGYAVAGMGPNVLVGAYQDDTSASDSGSAYLFDGATGTLLGTFNNPTPAISDYFGQSLAAFDDAIVVGAPEDDQWAANSGVIHVFRNPLCGDGAVQFGEDCDDANAVAGDCCSPTCGFEAAGTVCRASAGVCDAQETCTGSSGTCPADDKVTAGTVCRAAVDVCDAAETCDGATNDCPADAKMPSDTVCRAAVGVCDAPETCTGSSDACPADAKRPSSFVCRASAAACDAAETCTGASNDCPADVKASAGTVCRASAGACDPAEICDGVTTSCPPDSKSPAGTTCRASAGVCDVAEQCDGSSAACPADAKLPNTVQCRASAGVCDQAEFCTGTDAACPADQFQPNTVVCRAAAGDCDAADFCTGVGAACPADAKKSVGTQCRAAAGACDVAETCDGASNTCPPDGRAPATTVCRPAAGTCDVAEKCDGASTDCPTDVLTAAGTTCRAAVGACDVAETCSGSSPICPADQKQPSGTECRAANGACDVAETCDGTTTACPADGFAASTVMCGAATGACDVDAFCTGFSSTCPANGFRPIGTVCRESTSTCDPAETCTGTSAGCPADVPFLDTDNDTVCDGQDDCPNNADASQADTDGDGIGDACDPCTGGPLFTSAKLKLTKLLFPGGDDGMTFKASVTLPGGTTVDPVAQGVRLIISRADGTKVVDIALPAGAFDIGAGYGWRAATPKGPWVWLDRTNLTPLKKATVKVKTPASGGVVVNVAFVASKSDFGAVGFSLPVDVTLVLAPPYATAGQCGETAWTSGASPCRLLAGGNVALCK